MKSERYDLAIIGAGSAGLIAADFASKLGARVALLERDRIGGDCTWTGCVPSKALLRVAKAAHEMRTSARFGIRAHEPVVDMPSVREYLRSAIAQIYTGTTPEALQQKGIRVLFGDVSFVDGHNLRIGDGAIRAAKILIATGATPSVPNIPGLAEVPYSTYREIFENDRLPKTMCVIGGGPVGVEVAQAYRRLGTHVTLFAEQLLPRGEPEAADILMRVLQREGLEIITERALSVERIEDRVAVTSAQRRVDCEVLFVATGRRPILSGLNLEGAGVKYSQQGISVNDHLQTSSANVYAAGDVVGGRQFSHLAGWQGFQAARNALLPGNSSGTAHTLPSVTFTDPEVAQVGQTEAEARRSHGDDIIVASWPIEKEDRAICDDDRDGILKFITKRDGTILGATIVAHRAGETISELAVAMQTRMKIGDVARCIHPYPTYSTGVQLLAADMAVAHALEGWSGRLIRTMAKVMG